ncbi:MAG: GIY-YIG nuclease family protein [Tyzzerella sp.]|nr:GIY-YIG nuclease family protein [Tyzzerella sp.]
MYIGQTSETIEKRFARHIGYQKDEHDTKFYRAIRKYGKENFKIEAIDYADTQQELDEKEIYYIKLYDSVKNGYNSKDSIGKCGGDTLSEHQNLDEIKEKIRQSKLGDKNPMKIYGGLHGPRNGMYGKNGKLNPFAKRCKAVSLDGSDTKYFDTLTELQQYFNVTTLGMVTMRCRGKTKSPYNGYYFRYCEDDEKSQTTIERIATD